MILRFPALLLASILTESATAWVLSTNLVSPKTFNRPPVTAKLPLRTHVAALRMMADKIPENDEEEEDCEDEDECEIDWSMMPGATPDETEEKLAKLEAQFQTLQSSEEPPDFELVSRQRLEMNWQIQETADECDVYEPATCGGQVCATCSGTGRCACRFCRGTGSLHWTSASMESDVTTSHFVSCTVCAQAGTEGCKSCQGTGWIADWTDIGAAGSFNP